MRKEQVINFFSEKALTLGFKLYFMKRFLLSAGVLFSLVSFTQAQKNVYLRINHQLGSDAFAFNKTFYSSEGDSVKYTRMQYYISGIKLIHDGGQVSDLSDTYLLVNAGSADSFSLGVQNLNSLESIRFYIGVDAGVNHDDPAAWPNNHPLAPKSPSMHWGWEAGYRFLAMEGKSGNALNQAIEVHSLGDGCYFETVISTSGVGQGSDLSIQLNADYTKAVMGLKLSSGMIRHGDGPDERSALLNFVQHVFTSSEGNQAVLAVQNPGLNEASLYPNPSNGNAFLRFEEAGQRQIEVRDVQGKLIFTQATDQTEVPLNWTKPGIYLISISAAENRKTLTWIIR